MWAQIVIVIVAASVFVWGIVHKQPATGPMTTPTETATPSGMTASPTVEPSHYPTVTPLPTKAILPATPTATPVPEQTNNAFEQSWIYSGATIVSRAQAHFTLTSNDDPDTIFNWYVDRFTKEDLSTQSKVRTKTNDTYVYVLAGANPDVNVKVEIDRSSGEQTATIKLEVHGPAATL